jgi:hypothetical protein
MGKRIEYPHGTFSFAGVMTNDVEGAKSLYSEFFQACLLAGRGEAAE